MRQEPYIFFRTLISFDWFGAPRENCFFQAQMATAHRLAAQTTTASRARAVVATTKPAAPMKPFAASTEIATKLTRPEPFSFATTSRTKGAAASGPMRAEEAVDFSKMLRNFNAANPTVCLSCLYPYFSFVSVFQHSTYFSREAPPPRPPWSSPSTCPPRTEPIAAGPSPWSRRRRG